MADHPATGRAPHALALLTALAAVPLILFGGSVTTLGAGMAVDGWLVPEGHLLPLFPAEKWFRDTGTMVEHTHRLFGMAVGLLAVATAVAAVRARRPWLAVTALLAVCGQGALGGFRVLEASPELAFLHGALAQAVFALLCCSATALSPTFAASARGSLPAARPAAGAARLALVAAYVQVVLGAWYRHGLRGGADGGEVALGLALHFGGALLVLAACARAIGRTLALADEAAAPLRRGAKRLGLLLGVQVLLGLLAWASRTGREVGALEWATSVLHVLCGGLLLAQVAVTALWAGRLSAVERTAAAPLGRPA